MSDLNGTTAISTGRVAVVPFDIFSLLGKNE